jgi:hypothetical protein
MSKILTDWSLADLLLFGGVFTALAAGAAIFLAESWFQKKRQRKEHFKIWQDRQLKIWQEQQRESFLRLGRNEQGFDDKNEDNRQKNSPLLLHERVNDFRRKGIGDRTADNALHSIERNSLQADSRFSGSNKNTRNHRDKQRAASAALVLPESTMPRFRRVDPAWSGFS